MCHQKYTHFSTCSKHVPIHTHSTSLPSPSSISSRVIIVLMSCVYTVCPKNITEDITRIIFCEDYQTARIHSNEVCPYCPPRDYFGAAVRMKRERERERREYGRERDSGRWAEGYGDGDEDQDAYPTPPKSGRSSDG